MFSLLQYQFVRHALVAGMLASIVCGIIGVIIVEKKLVMMSGGIAHTSYGGVGLGYLLGFEPVIGALIISVLASLGIVYIRRRGVTRPDVVIGLFWSFGMALGILFISLMPGYPPDLSSYLFGSILSVTRTDLYFMTVLTLLVVFIIAVLFNYWKTYMFDEEFASIIGINTAFLEYLLFILIAMAVVVLIRVVGIILALALFTAPPAVGGMLAKKLELRMIYAVGTGFILCLTGLWLSYVTNIPSGAAIVILAAMGYLTVYAVVAFKTRSQRKRISSEG